MHRHGYQGRKLHRERDQRRALIKGLADSLIKYESITTTLPKAKETLPYVEKLITKAKKGDLHNRRIIISKLQTLESAHKLIDEIAPKLKTRNSGYLRINKLQSRRGDNSEMASISFVDDIKGKVSESKEEPAQKASAKKSAEGAKNKPVSQTKTSVAKKTSSKETK